MSSKKYRAHIVFKDGTTRDVEYTRLDNGLFEIAHGHMLWVNLEIVQTIESTLAPEYEDFNDA
jgi:hypothetical protein